MPPGPSNEPLSALRAEKDFGKKIATMVILFGLDTLRDHRRFLALLEDFHPGDEAKGDRHLLRVALEQGIGSALLSGPPSPAERKRMENRLTNLFIAPEHAVRIVDQLERAIQEAKFQIARAKEKETERENPQGFRGDPGKVIAAMPVRAARMNCSPFFPLRAMDGGRFMANTPKPADGPWFYEPKVNGCRVLVHLHDDGSIDVWNQYGQWLSIFEKLDFTQFRLLLPPGYYDCELPGANCGAMRGHIVVIDVPDFGGTWRSMKTWLRDKIPNLLGLKTPFENHGRRNLWILPDVGEFRADRSPIVYPDDHLFVKEHLQLVNIELGVDFYEGFAAKNPVLKYMRQPTDSAKEHPGWIQYRF
ncbi:MAG: ATP-dependent DNA ligase [Opitutales bacterium]|nr:ATP-dependent DNA ligase [Opitutales bacterium]